MKRRNYVLGIFLLFIIIWFIIFISYCDLKIDSQYKALKTDLDYQSFVNDIFNYSDLSKKLPEDQESLISKIKKAMQEAGIHSYLNYRRDPFQEDGLYQYHKLSDSSFVVLSAGIDGEIDNMSIDNFSSLKLYNEKPGITSKYFGDKDLLLAHYEIRDGKWHFLIDDSYWLESGNNPGSLPRRVESTSGPKKTSPTTDKNENMILSEYIRFLLV